MIISKTPYRISFFGGGTDYPDWYRRFGGEVISTTIDKYIYITARYLPPFFKYRYRIVYSKVETVNKVNDIEHIVVRELIKQSKIKKGIELHYDGDLPSKSGMGSSSSFIVGCMNIFLSLNKDLNEKKNLAQKSLNFEQNILKEIVGSQDQVASSYGGFNSIIFNTDGSFLVKLIKLKKTIKEKLNKRLFLVFTGYQRRAHDFASLYVKDLSTKKIDEMNSIQEHVTISKQYLSKGKLDDFGYLLHESWIKKKELSKHISSNFIDDIYNKGLKNGALGGKILGAGGGGFLLFYVDEKQISNFKKSLDNFAIIPFNFENKGSKIIFNNE
jgi:D-glycero-alpha-D-manno-heptose-7-phosphate kinase